MDGRHWPRLKLIELSVFGVVGPEVQSADLVYARDKEVVPLDVSAWLPDVLVTVPERCYQCPCCGYQSCDA